MTWGIESNVIKRLGAAGVPKDSISCVRDTYTFCFASPPTELVDAFRKYYGPTMNAFDAAEKNGRSEDLKKELNDLFNSQNRSPVADATLIPATYLRVIVARWSENPASTSGPRLRIRARTGNGRARESARRLGQTWGPL